MPGKLRIELETEIRRTTTRQDLERVLAAWSVEIGALDKREREDLLSIAQDHGQELPED